MKVLHINQSDVGGGAAIAGYRLHKSLLDRDVHSRQLVGSKQTSSDLVNEFPRSFLERNLDRIAFQLGFNYLDLQRLYQQTTSCLSKHEFYIESDILNFHNLHTGYFNYFAIDNITCVKPAVYTLHDMWSFTGHCSYSYDCTKWKTGCGHCPYPEIYPAIKSDTTAIEWKLKNWVYSRSNITVVTPSRWLTEQAQESMLNRFPIHHIPNGIDTNIYQPLNSAQCRGVLNIPLDKQVLMFGAASLSDVRKGGDILHKALIDLPQSLKSNIILITLGISGESIAESIGIPTIDLGYISSDHLKAIAYSAADLFLFPTRADNLPLVLQESMSCGTPMVSFKIGGVPDLVRPDETGYLAPPEDVDDFRKGIIQLLEDSTHRHQMAQNCRAIAIKEYSLEMQAERYISLYRDLLK
jgi:glycosyltransferase involved in cell wall biosynthesis